MICTHWGAGSSPVTSSNGLTYPFSFLPRHALLSIDGDAYGEDGSNPSLLTDLDGLSVLEFDERSEDWLRFVVSSRLGTAPNVDLVIGYMAGGGSNLKSKFTKLRNSNVSIDVAATAMRKELTSTQLGVQYAFLTEKALSKLVRVSTEIVEMED